MHKILLLVEDDPFIRDVYQEVLTDAGYEVELAVDGQEGLLKAQEGGYSLVLLDIMMPKLNGIQLLEELKSHPPKKANGPIILLTNLGHDSVIKDGLEKGAKSYLIKSSINPNQLVEHVKKFLG